MTLYRAGSYVGLYARVSCICCGSLKNVQHDRLFSGDVIHKKKHRKDAGYYKQCIIAIR